MYARRLGAAACLLTAGITVLTPAAASAKSCSGGAAAAGNVFAGGMSCSTEPTTAQEKSKPVAIAGQSAVRYEYRSACGSGLNEDQPSCPLTACPAGEQQYRLWKVAPPPASPLGIVCVGPDEAVPAAAAPPQVTPGMVAAAFRRIPLPELRSHSQPANKTLINFDTIFFTDAEPLTRQVTLLGQRIRLEITPSSFEWVHGDGSTATTSDPGAPYPSKEIVYRYADAHTTVAHRVVVTWSAQWSLNGGPLQPVNGTVTTAGPATPLRVAEASPALSGEGH